MSIRQDAEVVALRLRGNGDEYRAVMAAVAEIGRLERRVAELEAAIAASIGKAWEWGPPDESRSENVCEALCRDMVHYVTEPLVGLVSDEVIGFGTKSPTPTESVP